MDNRTGHRERAQPRKEKGISGDTSPTLGADQPHQRGDGAAGASVPQRLFPHGPARQESRDGRGPDPTGGRREGTRPNEAAEQGGKAARKSRKAVGAIGHHQAARRGRQSRRTRLGGEEEDARGRRQPARAARTEGRRRGAPDRRI